MPQVLANDISIYYERHGDHASPLVMISGRGGDTAAWLPEQIQRLSMHHRVIIFDNRGVGKSDKPTTPYSMAQFAADTVGLLDVLQLERVHLFGYSMGGCIAQHVALNYPSRVRSLILAGTAPFWTGHPLFIAPSQEALAQLTSPPSGDRAQDLRQGWKRGFSPTFIEANRDFLERKLQERLAHPEPPAYALQLQYEAVATTHDTYSRLDQIGCPTLILAGTADILVPAENSQIMARLIPNARLIEYPGTGHGFIVESCIEVEQDILAFLDEVDQVSDKVR
jgi:3-oxoadipate enol-lactonase